MNAITTNTATHLIQHHTINNAGFVVFESRWWRRGADRNTWARYDAETRELTVQKTSRGIITDDYRAEIGDFCAEYGIDFAHMRHGDRVTVVLPEPADAAITVTNNRRGIMDLAGDAVTAAWNNALDMAATGDDAACANYIETVTNIITNTTDTTEDTMHADTTADTTTTETTPVITDTDGDDIPDWAWCDVMGRGLDALAAAEATAFPAREWEPDRDPISAAPSWCLIGILRDLDARDDGDMRIVDSNNEIWLPDILLDETLDGERRNFEDPEYSMDQYELSWGTIDRVLHDGSTRTEFWVTTLEKLMAEADAASAQ